MLPVVRDGIHRQVGSSRNGNGIRRQERRCSGSDGGGSLYGKIPTPEGGIVNGNNRPTIQNGPAGVAVTGGQYQRANSGLVDIPDSCKA